MNKHMLLINLLGERRGVEADLKRELCAISHYNSPDLGTSPSQPFGLAQSLSTGLTAFMGGEGSAGP